MNVLDWLLDSDPAIRWQVLRDLRGAPPAIVATERARTATEGWGARLLALQGEDGQMGRRRLLPSAQLWMARGEPRSTLDFHFANTSAFA